MDMNRFKGKCIKLPQEKKVEQVKVEIEKSIKEDPEPIESVEKEPIKKKKNKKRIEDISID